MIKQLLMQKSILWLLLIINTLGTIYGYIWYEHQLIETPAIFLIFVPDSPTASLFFVVVLVGFLLNKNFKYFEALAMLTLFKYGVWAVIMNILTFMETGNITAPALMLIVSHGAMAIQGLLYSPFYRIGKRHLIFAAIWTLHNDVIDYVYGMMPSYGSLSEYMDHIGYFTFWLSLFSIYLVFRFGYKPHRSRKTT
ncbi:DUF1405 domain-containing protein [Halalkalibacillus sediminis]|uniref:DUF1405 domain-containing protein n=2 Tax=Halalkalibacillus sediminis TaxID=2018042 RepID=A0A2I0QX08_9BACI|nr:DUF1405 domain-containing protein [Halalkalibacillus sediminis]PKR78839.1 DUF1405 domain-containing protein [Halalkalibacillus sediminis]